MSEFERWWEERGHMLADLCISPKEIAAIGWEGRTITRSAEEVEDGNKD